MSRLAYIALLLACAVAVASPDGPRYYIKKENP